MIKLIVSDIDGTLVRDGENKINQELFDVIMRLKREKQIHFAAASGRQAASIEYTFAPIGKEIFYIAENGAYLGCLGRNLFLYPMKRADAVELIEDIRKNPSLDLVISGSSHAYMETKNQEFINWVRDGYHFDVVQVEDVTKVDDSIIKVAAYKKSDIQAEAGAFWDKYKDRMKITISGDMWMDCMALEVNKGEAVKTLQESLGIAPEETMAFGDQLNDVEMSKEKRMSRRKKWRIRSAAAVLISLPLLLSGCQKTESILAGMGGEKGYERPEIMIAAMSQKNTCEELCTGQIWSAQVDESGKTFEEYTKEQLKSFMDELKILTLLAKERNISLTEEEASAMAKASEEYLAALTPEDISYMGVDETSVNTMFHDYCLANKTVEELTKDLDMEVSDSEAKVIQISEVRTADREAAQAVSDSIEAGASLEKAAASEGLEVSSAKIGRADRGEDYDYAAFALETGEVSKVVEDQGEYCVIRCDNDYDQEATAQRKEQIYDARRQKAFQDIYSGFKEGITLNDSVKDWEALTLGGEAHAENADFFEIYRKHTLIQTEQLGE